MYLVFFFEFKGQSNLHLQLIFVQRLKRFEGSAPEKSLDSKRHQILCIICLCVESQSRSSPSLNEEDIVISDTTVSKLPGTCT